MAGIDLNPAHAAAARALVLDAVAVDCVSALRDAGVRAVLLKGPVTARWLYPDSALRDYVDIDLLVAPARFQQASQALGRFGFSDTQADRAPNEIPPHAHALSVEGTAAVEEAARFPAGLCVDLHRSFHGIGASDEAFWTVVADSLERMRISDADLEVPNEPMRALLLALHAATSAAVSGQALSDLDRGLERVSDETWAAAYDHAVRLDAIPRFLAGLAMLPSGVRLIDRLQLEGGLDMRSALVAQGIPPVAGGVERLMNTPGVGHKARLLVRELIPTRSFMRDWSVLARSGPLGLALAYAYRPAWLLTKLPAALRARAQARQAVKAGRLSERRAESVTRTRSTG